MENTLGFIGFGKMANAICNGIVQSSFIPAENIFAYDVNQEALNNTAKSLGINPVFDIEELMKKSSTVLIATKPFVISDVLENIKNLADNKLIISILAGITIDTYERYLKNSRIIRVMPNTPAMVNEGATVICGSKNIMPSDMEFASKLFSTLGTVDILDENLINAVTGVSGSGPAFYYYIIDKIAHAGEKIGLDYKTALKLSAQTALGSAKMILETGKTPDELITAVTTPNGTTAEGNKVLINSDIENILFETVEKTYKRAIELGLKK